jgi:hypothetical protein
MKGNAPCRCNGNELDFFSDIIASVFFSFHLNRDFTKLQGEEGQVSSRNFAQNIV